MTMLLLLAQILQPPLQPGPVRLPQDRPAETRGTPSNDQGKPVLEDADSIEAPSPSQPEQPHSESPSFPVPDVAGSTLYEPSKLTQIFSSCSQISDHDERVTACAAALSAQLVSDGYINSRVAVETTGKQSILVIREGKLVEVRVSGDQPQLNRQVERLLRPLIGKIVNVNQLERSLQQLKQLESIRQIRANLAKLGSDPLQATVSVAVESRASRWRGGLSLSNDGNSGTGESRFTGSLYKNNLLTYGDTLLLYSELNSDDRPRLGTGLASITYQYPISNQWSLTTALGYSSRQLIELPEPNDDLSTTQSQGLIQANWNLLERLGANLSAFAGISINDNNTRLDGASLPSDVPDIVRKPRTSYLRLGLNGSHQESNQIWSGSAYFLQGLNAFSYGNQLSEWGDAGITPTQSRAIGALISNQWAISDNLTINTQIAGQWAFAPLLPSMQFTLGSDVGLRGLPGQLISGDNGWLATIDTPWTVWRQSRQALQLVPFFGMGGVSTDTNEFSYNDTVGSTGLFLRYLNGSQWELELGYAYQFSTDDNSGPWEDWLLNDGLYAKVRFSF